jgi:tight adherence protein B
MMMATREILMVCAVTMGSVVTAAVALYPIFTRRLRRTSRRLRAYQTLKVQQTAKALDDVFIQVKPRWLQIAYGVGPIACGLLAFAVWHNTFIALVGSAAGLVIPDLWVRQANMMRRRKFQGQLVDALFILSSSLRAGLSLTQAFEQLESEMPPPASQEFGLMMKAHKLGRTLEQSLQGLYDRTPCDELELIKTAVLVV